MIFLRRLAFVVGLGLSLPAIAGLYDDILVAAAKDDTAQVIDLLKRGMDVNTSDPTGNTLLMIAARNGNEQLLEFLLRNRANTLKINKFGDSALMMAAYRGHGAIVGRLLATGSADTRRNSWNALHYAAYAGHVDIVRQLARQQGDLDAVAPNGQTALMLAAKAGKLDAVKALVDADADIDLEDYDGKSAIMLAEAAGHSDVVEYLREEGAFE